MDSGLEYNYFSCVNAFKNFFTILKLYTIALTNVNDLKFLKAKTGVALTFWKDYF
jgi:hypothetical protein